MKFLHTTAAAAMLAIAFSSGCYDGDLLVLEARSAAHNTRLAEVDLGHFLTTLPRDRKNNSFTDLEVHLFATVPHSRVSSVKRQLAMEEYRLRHDLLAAVRGATSEELTEPSLAQLRQRVEKVIDAILADQPVKSIGFYQVSLRQR
jgi:hypothetical protein